MCYYTTPKKQCQYFSAKIHILFGGTMWASSPTYKIYLVLKCRDGCPHPPAFQLADRRGRRSLQISTRIRRERPTCRSVLFCGASKIAAPYNIKQTSDKTCRECIYPFRFCVPFRFFGPSRTPVPTIKKDTRRCPFLLNIRRRGALLLGLPLTYRRALPR